VTACDRDGRQEALLGHRGPVLLSLHRGDDSVGVATSLAGHDHGVDVVVDLTTQSTATAVAADRLAKAGGARYWAGGLTGGAAALERVEGVFLLGPPDLPQPVRTALEHAGRVVEFTTAAQAVVAKLIHNYVLLSGSYALAFALAAAEQIGCRDAVVEAIVTGPAGRPGPAQSVVRDAYGRGRSSYSVRLVRKDLDQLQRSLPAVAGVAGASVADLRSVLAGADPIQPFTHALLDDMRARLAEVSWP
jgi:3-hydroxyisobutyrate dehydrogenase-like beta-hydroxyacid dehydrogenase